MRMTPEKVALRAFQIVLEVMQEGSSKDGNDDSWLDKPKRYHVDKCMRHIINNELEGKEPHLHYALARLAMAICQEG